MKRFFSTLLFAGTLFYLQSGVAAIKCWTNSEGFRECGNMVPPEYAQQETRTINKRGITTEIKGRAMTRQEVLEERRLAEEQKAKAEAEKKRKQEQASRDRVLLATFLKAEEIIAARDRKLAVYDGYLELSHISIGKLNKRLEGEQRRVADFERSGKPVPDYTKEQIRSIRSQITARETFMRQQESERELLRKKYDADYQRFIELKGGRR